MFVSTSEGTNPNGEKTTLGYIQLNNDGYLMIQNSSDGVFSIYAKCSSSGTIGIGNDKRTVSSSWNRFIFENVSKGCQVFFGKGTYFIYDAKFETGDKATDWTPAPEDVDADISSVEGKVTTLSTQYTSLSQTLTSLNATVNSHTTQISSKADNSTVTTINDKVTSLTADLSGFKTTVSDTYATKESVSTVSTVATQTADKFNWLVKSGTSSSDFTITDRLATLTANYINLNGLVTFSGLNQDVKDEIDNANLNASDALYSASQANSTANTANSTASSANSTAISAAGTASSASSSANAAYSLANSASSTATTANTKAQGIMDNIYTTNTTTINGGKITTGSITADKLKVDSLEAIVAKIGGFSIDSNSIKNGTYGTDGSVMMCTGSISAKSIGGSASISGWCFTAGDKFGVTKTGALYASNVKVSGDVVATSGTIGKLLINGDYLQSDSGTSGNIYRMFIQKPTESTTWCFSTQYGSTTKLVGNFYARADGFVYCTSLTSDGNINTNESITANGSITANSSISGKGTLEMATNANASNVILHDDYERRMYIRYTNGTLWFVPATNSGLEAGHSVTIDAATGNMTANANLECKGTMTVRGNGLELYYTTPYIDFHLNNSSSDYTARLLHQSSGVITCYNTISNASDRSLKKDIKDISLKYIDVLSQLRPREYRFKKGDEHLNLGFIAQEVEDVLKNCGISDKPLVSKGEDGIYSLDYNGIIPILTLGYQNLKKDVNRLEAMVTHLIGIAMSNH